VTPAPPTRVVHRADALVWLRQQPSFAGHSFITSLPDVSEMGGMPLATWKEWFRDAAALVMSCTPDDGLAIFYQSDIREEGAWIDKGYLCGRAAEELGLTTLFHKVICRKPPGTLTFGRPGYSHLLGFSRGVRLNMSKAQPDVLAEPGVSSWTRGMGSLACRLACQLVLDHTTHRAIIDPFCGRGMVLAVANEMGLDSIGVEISVKRARMAEKANL
jgi:hypothetical protein